MIWFNLCLKPIGPCTGFIYPQLFKYTQHHTTENNWAQLAIQGISTSFTTWTTVLIVAEHISTKCMVFYQDYVLVLIEMIDLWICIIVYSICRLCPHEWSFKTKSHVSLILLIIGFQVWIHRADRCVPMWRIGNAWPVNTVADLLWN